jgi:hypothetical protein
VILVLPVLKILFKFIFRNQLSQQAMQCITRSRNPELVDQDHLTARVRHQYVMTQSAVAAVEQKLSKIPGAGMGAFAMEYMPKGTIVAAMEDGVIISAQDADEWESVELHCTVGLSTKYSMRDANLTYDYKPTWHWFNHRNSKFNLKPSALNGNVVWRTVRDVEVGEELTWQYNSPRNMRSAFSGR